MADTLPELKIDTEATGYLNASARWGRFLGGLGFVVSSLLVLFAFIAGSLMGSMYKFGGETGDALGDGFYTTLFLITAAFIFLPSFFLFRFGARARAALISRDQLRMNAALKNLKWFISFFGIMTVLLLAFYGVLLIIAVVTAAVSWHAGS